MFALAADMLDRALLADPSLLADDDASEATAAEAPAAADAPAPAAAPAASWEAEWLSDVEPLEPTGRQKYDPLGCLFKWAGEAPAPRRAAAKPAAPRGLDPVAGMLAATMSAGRPQRSRFDPLEELRALQPPSGARWDPLRWLLDGWAGDRYEARRGTAATGASA